MKLIYDEVDTPIGILVLMVRDLDVCMLEFTERAGSYRSMLDSRFGKVELAHHWNPHGYSDRVRAYFGGDLHALDDLPAEPGGTPFQRAVWAELRKIPVGETRAYSEIARAVGRPTATRAVGRANGQNPLALILPCHRVIGADGSLTGYGGGLDRKRWLLRHEGADVPSMTTATFAWDGKEPIELHSPSSGPANIPGGGVHR